MIKPKHPENFLNGDAPSFKLNSKTGCPWCKSPSLGDQMPLVSDTAWKYPWEPDAPSFISLKQS